MKKLLYFIILLIPFMVFGENSEIYISKVEKVSGEGIVLDNPKYEGLSLELFNEFININDSIKYKITIQNDSDEKWPIALNEDNLISNHFLYQYEMPDYIEPKSSIDTYLVVTFERMIDAEDEDFFDEKNEIEFVLNNENPNTVDYIFIVGSIFVVGLVIYLVVRRKNKYALLGLLLLPGYIFAKEVLFINVVSNNRVNVTKNMLDVVDIYNRFSVVRLTNTVYSPYDELVKGNKPFSFINKFEKRIDTRKKIAKESEVLFDDLVKYVINLNIVVDGTVPSEYEFDFDISYKKDKSVMAYYIINDKDDNYLDLYIVSNDKIKTNFDSKALFFGYYSLEKIEGIENLNTSYTRSMYAMFAESFVFYEGDICLDLSTFDTSNVENMEDMFVDFGVNAESVVLDLSSFNTRNVGNMSGMFFNSGVKTIYVSDLWNTTSVIYSDEMFEKCLSLVGELGTHYDIDNVDVEYARIDGNGGPGYLSTKESGPFVINVSSSDMKMGTVSGSGTFDKYESVSLKATCEDGYGFIGWYNNEMLLSTDINYNFKAFSNRNIVGKFGKKYNVKLNNLNSDLGTVNGEGSFIEGSKVLVKAMAIKGYAFNGWYDKDDKLISKRNSYSFVMPSSDVILNAKFEPYKGSSWNVEEVTDEEYTFVLNENGYYESNNQGVDNSYAVIKVNFDIVEDDTTIDFHCINFAENGYDYGIIGYLDDELYGEMGGYYSFEDSSSQDEQVISIGDVSEGEHSIYIYYTKDSSYGYYNDSFQFKIGFNGDEPVGSN